MDILQCRGDISRTVRVSYLEAELSAYSRTQGLSLTLLDKFLDTELLSSSSSLPPALSCQVQSHTATVHLWRAICLQDKHIR